MGYRTTGRELLDLNFGVSSLRGESDYTVTKSFLKAFYQDKIAALRWLFFAADVRGGMGERRLFRVITDYMAHAEPRLLTALLPLITEYTRWDNLIRLIDSPVGDEVFKITEAQLNADLENAAQHKPVSLCAKWMPSLNASSEENRRLAKIFAKRLGMTSKQYRKLLVYLRAEIGIVETYMSANKWHKIDYSAVPSRANAVYYKAFMLNDKKRREKFLEALKNNETKINSGVLFPHDIVLRYAPHLGRIQAYDETLEQLWKALPDYVNGDGTTLCVADGSGSMTCPLLGTDNLSPLHVADALAIYFAERCRGQFKNRFITFSEHPQFVDMSNCSSLHDKIAMAYGYNEVANTNIEAVFDLILTTAVKYKMSPADMSKTVLILSDMEFDYAVDYNERENISPRLFEQLDARYKDKGYALPRLVFWNINSRTKTIPVTQNDAGVALVSGFSPVSVKMVLSNKVDPYECLMYMINDKRYDKVEEAVKPLLQ